MSFSTLATQLIYSNAWESYPYSSPVEISGDLYFFKNSEKGSTICRQKEIPISFFQLNIRKELKKRSPEMSPTMDTIGYAVKDVFKHLGIKEYVTAEDRGGESADFWASFEAVFLSKEEYENKILSRIEGISAERIGSR